MTVMNHTAEDCRNEQKTVSSGTRNLLIFLALAAGWCAYHTWNAYSGGIAVGHYFEAFRRYSMYFTTVRGIAFPAEDGEVFSLFYGILWCIRFIPLCLGVMLVAELGTPRDLHSDGDNSASRGVIEVVVGFIALGLHLFAKGLKFLFRSVLVALFGSAFLGLFAIFAYMKVWEYCATNLAVPLMLGACAAVKYAAALPLIDRIIQKTGLVRRSVYAPMAVFSAGLSGLLLLYGHFLGDILQGLHLMNSVSLPAIAVSMVLMRMPGLLAVYFTMRGAVEYGRK